MMAYSTKAHRFVLFGGWDGARGLNGTWVYDPGHRTWTELRPDVSPLGRGDEMFVYDERSDAFILFGGWHELANATYIRLGDTWQFTLENVTWTELHPLDSPTPRSDSQVAYDPAVDVVLLVGGFNGTAYLGDVWAYDVRNNSWSPRSAAVQPSARADGRMVYVPFQDRFILYGGNDYSGPNGSNHHLADTWAFSRNDNVWTPLTRAGDPGARDYPIFSFDPVTKMIFLTGGFGSNTILSGLWAFNVASEVWVDLTPAFSPPPRFASAGGFDLVNNVLVLFGGLGNNGLLADTWQYASEGSSPAPSLLSPLELVVVSSLVVVGVAVAVLLGLSRKRRLRGPR